MTEERDTVEVRTPDGEPYLNIRYYVVETIDGRSVRGDDGYIRPILQIIHDVAGSLKEWRWRPGVEIDEGVWLRDGIIQSRATGRTL